METPQAMTHLETRVLTAIERHIRSEGVAPTIAELATSLRLKSKGTVHRYVQSLIGKGRLERHGNGWRGLRIVGQTAALPVHGPSGQSTGNAMIVSGEENLPALRIPLLGRIAAGQPIEAIEDTNYLDLAAFFIGPDRYALRVSGNSMMDAGILDGDTVILRKQDTARVGDIVVALIDAQEATLKRLGDVRDGMVELIPENSEMSPMHYAAQRVSFQGVLVGQLRSY